MNSQPENCADFLRYIPHCTNSLLFNMICRVESPLLAAAAICRQSNYGINVMIVQNLKTSHLYPGEIQANLIIDELVKMDMRMVACVLPGGEWLVSYVPAQNKSCGIKTKLVETDVDIPNIGVCFNGFPEEFSGLRIGGVNDNINCFGGRIVLKFDKITFFGPNRHNFIEMCLLLGVRVFTEASSSFYEFVVEGSLPKAEPAKSIMPGKELIQRYYMLGFVEKAQFATEEWDPTFMVECESAIHSAKSRLADLSKDAYSVAKKNANLYEPLPLVLNGTVLPSRSGLKLAEIDVNFNLFDAKARVLDIAAPPGGFAAYMSSVIDPRNVALLAGKGDCDYPKSFSEMKFEMFTIKDYITLENVIDIMNQIDNTGFMGTNVVLGDIAPITKATGKDKEYEMYKLLIIEVGMGLHFLTVGGTLVLKLLGASCPCTQSLILYLCSLFRYVRLCKLKTSRTASSELFLVCQGLQRNFISIQDEVLGFANIGMTQGFMSREGNLDFILSLQTVVRNLVQKQCVGLKMVGRAAKNPHAKLPGQAAIVNAFNEDWKQLFQNY